MKFVKHPLVRNWSLYLSIVALFFFSAWVYGERLLYLGLFVFLAMPVASGILAVVLLRMLDITQSIPVKIVKNEEGSITLRLHNPTPLPYGKIECTFHTDDFAVEANPGTTLGLSASQTFNLDIPFYVRYRGVYKVGLRYVYTHDLFGLFRLRRRLNKGVNIVALPRIVDMAHFPLSMNLLTQAHSRFDIKDEDYATISDIRPYLPTDSIKRVHWKLTAKRNEWLVKNFQSNALNKVTMLLDSLQLPLAYKEQTALEDRIIETAMGLARFYLRKGMPVDFMVGEGTVACCHNPAAFETIYQIGSQMVFSPHPLYSPLSMLTQCLNDATGYLNTLILTTRLDGALYERIVTGMHSGHYIAVIYFSTVIRDFDSEKIYELLVEGSAPCFRIDEESFADTPQEGDEDV